MITETTTPAATPMATASKNSMLWFATRPPAAAAPIATMPNWPRLIWPAQPVRITSETATMPKMGRTTRSGMLGLPMTNGTITTTATLAANSAMRATTTSRWARSSTGIGRNIFTDSHVEVPASYARESAPRCTSSETRMTMSISADA